MIDFPQHDWFTTLACLEHHGVSNTDAADRTQIERTKLRRIKAGMEPAYSDGGRLLKLHSQYCACDHIKGDFALRMKIA